MTIEAIKKFPSESGIYKITSPNGRVYIGQSINLKNRENQYKNIKVKYIIGIYAHHSSLI